MLDEFLDDDPGDFEHYAAYDEDYSAEDGYHLCIVIESYAQWVDDEPQDKHQDDRADKEGEEYEFHE